MKTLDPTERDIDPMPHRKGERIDWSDGVFLRSATSSSSRSSFDAGRVRPVVLRRAARLTLGRYKGRRHAARVPDGGADDVYRRGSRAPDGVDLGAPGDRSAPPTLFRDVEATSRSRARPHWGKRHRTEPTSCERSIRAGGLRRVRREGLTGVSATSIRGGSLAIRRKPYRSRWRWDLALTFSAHGQNLSPYDVNALPSKPANARVAYGKDSLQFGELRLPEGPGPFPVAIIIHGGCWLSRFATLKIMSPLADALAKDGIATWNIEYRRIDNPGGGWPGSFDDVADGVDHVRTLAAKRTRSTRRGSSWSAIRPGLIWRCGRRRSRAFRARACSIAIPRCQCSAPWRWVVPATCVTSRPMVARSAARRSSG